MHGWKPESENEFAGDMMPFWDGTRFHLFYLLDRDHHAAQNGLGGHQWAHAASFDLVNWRHYPLALPIGEALAYDQHGICTGAIFEHDGVYHAFYATRLKREDGSVYEAICQAQSRDLVHFEKSPNNPLFAAQSGLHANDHRDPFVFRDEASGEFHMIVTAKARIDAQDRGVLAHYTSPDLQSWQVQEPFLVTQSAHAPECPEIFQWNDWWYLLYSLGGRMEFWISRQQLGPWQRARRAWVEPGQNLTVPRTAAFHDNRRIAVGFLPWRREACDEESSVYAGNAIFRELLQDPDGTLWTRLVPEIMPATRAPQQTRGEFSLEAAAENQVSIEAPVNCLLTLHFVPSANAQSFGLLLRADENAKSGYKLSFWPREKRMTLGLWPVSQRRANSVIEDIDRLDEAVDVMILLQDSVVDVCINGRQTLANRCFERRGNYLGLWAQNGAVRVEKLQIAPLL